jgi:PhnB protein
MKVANPYLYFDGNTLEAFTFYKSVFGGEFLGVLRYRDFPGNPMGIPEGDLDKIAHIALPLGKHTVLMGTDFLPSMPMKFVVGSNVSITLEPESGREADDVFHGLAAGGTTEGPLQKTEWAEKHGSCVDRFGVHWMVSYPGNVQSSGG